MKLCILSREYPPHGAYFGSAAYYQRLARAMSARGHEVHVVCQAVGRPGLRHDDGVRVHRVGRNPARGNPLARLDFSLRSWLKARALIEAEGIEVVDAPLWPPDGFTYSLWERRAPLVIQAHAWARMHIETRSYSSPAERAQLELTAWGDRVTVGRADVVVANSAFTRRRLIGEFRIPPEKLEQVPHGIDVDLYRRTPSDARKRLRVPQGTPLVLYIGRLQPRKGLHTLVRAAPLVLRRLPEAVIALVGRDTDTAPGGGSLRRFLQSEARRRGIADNVRFVDAFLTDEQIVELYSACDVFVFPSLAETFGQPVLEAMACGKPVVTTATGIAAELTHHGEGLDVVPPGDADSLGRAIVRALSYDASRLDEIGERNRGLVEERFSFAAMVDRLEELYAAVRNSAPRP